MTEAIKIKVNTIIGKKIYDRIRSKAKKENRTISNTIETILLKELNKS
jgi:hypothetical protein